MIGIFTPYDHSETTVAALRLADLARRLGATVRVGAIGKCRREVDPYWDQHVLGMDGHGIYRTARHCKQLIWFEVATALRDMSKLVAPDAKHTLIPGWHQIPPGQQQHISSYDMVVCPSKMTCEVMRAEVFDGQADSRLTWARWDAGLPIQRRDGTVADHQLRVAVLPGPSTTKGWSSLCLHVLDELLCHLPRLYFTILQIGSWPRSDRAQMKRLRKRWGDRLVVRWVGSTLDQVREYHQHDWLFIPDLRADFGVQVARAHACGTPVLAFDLPPFDEYIQNDHNGQLIPCELFGSWLRAPTAIPVSYRVVQVAMRIFHDQHPLLALQVRDWNMEHANQAFRRFWARHWEIECTG